jgi:hypothetical protein
MTKLHGQALEMNKKFNAKKISDMDKLHSQALGMNKKFEADKLNQSRTAMDKLHVEALRINKKMGESREKALQYEQRIRKTRSITFNIERR